MFKKSRARRSESGSSKSPDVCAVLLAARTCVYGSQKNSEKEKPGRGDGKYTMNQFSDQ